jgi:Domain of unknown function (DUF4214)/RTX calcium-binding nonapeptide repeat (4 copies)
MGMATAEIFSTKAWFDFRSFDAATEARTSIPYLKTGDTALFVSSTDVDGTPIVARWQGTFVLDSNGAPVDGAITRIDVFDAKDGSALWGFSDIQIDLRAMADAILTGTPNAIFVSAFNGDDRIAGGLRNDYLKGYGGNDTFIGGPGNDVIDGGAGWSTAIYVGNKADYTWQARDDGSVLLTDGVAGRDGTDLLLNVQFLQFQDGFKFVLTGDEARVARLYGAAFSRAPDIPGLIWQIEKGLHGGLSFVQLANNFENSAEFIDRYGTKLSDEQYVLQLYRNVLGRDPDPDGYQWQLDHVRAGLERDQLLLNFADSVENQQHVLADWMVLG